MLLAWSVTEVIRYAYYVVNLLNLNVWSLTWLRYTLFIVLYPLGGTGELWCYYDSLAHLKKTNMFSMGMPNQLNFTFNSYLVAMIVMVLYLPGFPPMYQHMFVQRKKVLGNAVSAEVDRKKD
jgi:very-long-chain (3R)-3-hydroxyacyl-CoA dehydratase